MFYLFLSFLIILLVCVIFCTNRISVFCEISKERWTGIVKCKSWINYWGVEWQKKSDKHQLRLRVLFFSIPLRFKKPEQKRKKEKVKKRESIYHQMKSVFEDKEQKLDVLRRFQKVLHLDHWEVDGQSSCWDPATAGLIFVFLKLIKHAELIPVNVHVRPLFYPAPTFIRCHGKGHFKLIHLLQAVYRERKIWLPWVAGKQSLRRK